jgi:hypothetical protein
MLGFGWCLWSCNPVQSYSEIPEIHFKQLTVEDRQYTDIGIIRSAVLTFSFLDGDGDIGEIDPDTKNPVSRIYYTWYQKLPDQTYKQYEFSKDVITQASNIPYNSLMNKDEAQNKTLKGAIEIVISTPSISEGIDTMRIEYYITDRAVHSSNVDQTPDFSIRNITDVPIKAK